MGKADTDAVLVIAATGAVGLGALCAAGVVPAAALAAAVDSLGGNVLASVIANVLTTLGGAATSHLRSSTSLGKNNDLVLLAADAAHHCAQSVAERRPLWNILRWPQRWALERAARRLQGQWSLVDASSLGEKCRSEHVVTWFRQSMTDASGIAAPLDLLQWKNLLHTASAGKLANDLRDELAAELHQSFTHWVRERFKADATGGTPAKGRAYAALQMALLGGLYELTTQIADSSERTKVGIDELNKAAADIRERVEAIALAHQDLGGLAKQIRQSEARLLEVIAAKDAPRTILPAADPEGQRFVFRTERLTLVGREKELAELRAWLDDDRPFSWDLWTGPAGAGKSRLALHLCRERAARGWRAGFYDRQSDGTVRWDTWDPARDTLIVFDYVHERADKIGAALRELAGRRWPDGRRVRALLLEREFARPQDRKEKETFTTTLPPPAWFEAIIHQGNQDPAPFRNAHARQDVERPEYPIAGVDDAALAAIVREEAKVAGTDGVPCISDDEVAKRINVIKQIDPRARPLFAAMAAEAIREGAEVSGGTIATWNIDELVRHINEKERRDRWTKGLQNNGVTDAATIARWERFACLATMCGGLKGNARQTALNTGCSWLPRLEDWSGGKTYRLLISGGSSDEAAPLEPDVLGEAFVLDWLHRDGDFAAQLINLAWGPSPYPGSGDSTPDSGPGFPGFLSRTASNFPDDAKLEVLLAPVAAADPRALANAHYARAVRAFQTNELSKVVERGRQLLLDSKQPPLVQALGAFLWTQAPLCAAGNDEFFTAASILRREHSEDAAVREQLAKGLTNAIAHAGVDHARADRLLDELLAVADACRDDPAVQQIAFRGCGAAFISGVQHGVLPTGTVETAAGLLGRCPANDEVRQVAKMLVDAVHRVLEYLPPGDDRDALNAALAKLRSAYQDRFPD
ncbi:MAG: ATP-binding protein [Phycisphaerae bacterium]|nr:ATP-binding protein [Phycisphaerae bacterium]